MLKDRLNIIGYPALMQFSNGKMYEFRGKLRDEYNLTNFIMGDYLNYKAEEINEKPNYLTLYWKITKSSFYRFCIMFYTKPYLSIGLIMSVIIFFYAIFMPFGGNINENNEDKNEKVLKKNN